MVTVLKRTILRLLEQRGYVLVKKVGYDAAAVAPRSQAERDFASRSEAERAFYFKRVVELEEHNRLLTKAATEYALRGQELERELLAARTEIATNDYPRLEAERAFYLKRVVELEEHNRQLTESATKHALRVQKLERAIGNWLPEFEGDDGTVEYAKVSGVYVDGAEAPVAEDRLVAPILANSPGTVVILTFGQSNAANSCEERYAPRGAVHVFNIFDMKYYRAIDPLPGASDAGGSVWGRLGDRLIDAGFARSVLLVPIAFGATYVEDWAPGGQCYHRLMFALHRLKRAGIAVDMLCWHQGEADANHMPMGADEYHDRFHTMLRGVREVGVEAPVYVALATLCEHAHHPVQNSAQIRLGQKKLVSLRDRVLPGPDTDQIGIEHRRDGCHFAASGQELAAQAWFRAITASPLERLTLWSKYRLESMFAAKVARGVARPPAASSPLPAVLGTSPAASPLPVTTRATTVAPAASVAPVSPTHLPPSPVREFATDSDPRPEFDRAYRRLQGKLTLPINQAVAIYCAMRHLTSAHIPGDIVDCGEGVPEALAVIGASLVALGGTSRRLVLFDITSDFRHRPETSVPLWGTAYDLMAGRRPRPQRQKRVLPDVLVASGYPAERISMARYPVDVIDLARPVAFLGLTAETYDANRAAIRTLAPRVAIGGVIAVEGNEHTPRAAVPGCVQHHLDAVAEFLKAHRAELPFWQVTGEYRLGVKSRLFGQQG